MPDRNHGLIVSPRFAGVERLWHHDGGALTINGTRVAPAFWFDHSGLDNVAKTWTCRKTGTVLSELGSGDSPDLANPSPYGLELGARFLGAKSLQAASSTFGNVGTDDWILRVVTRCDSAGGGQVVKRLSAEGWMTCVWAGSGTIFKVKLQDSTGEANFTSAGNSSNLNDLLVVSDRSDKGACFINGVVSGSPTTISSRPGSLDSAAKLTLGAWSAGTNQMEGPILLAALWHAPAWLLSYDLSSCALEQHAILCGQQALHNALGAKTPGVL